MGPSIPHVLVVCCVMVVFSLPATCQATTYSGSGAGATSNVEGNPATDPSGMTCPASCLCPDVDTDLYTCYGDETVEVISFQGYGLTAIPTFIGEFPNLHTIDLSDNFLTNVPRGAFNEDNFPFLTNVYLQENYIANLEREAFEIDDIEVVDLSSNILEEFRFSAFDIDENFRELYLQDNSIETVILDGTRLNRENYPSLTIYLDGNSLPCKELSPERLRNSPYGPLCMNNFLANDGAVCRVPNSATTVNLAIYCASVRSILSQPPPQTQDPLQSTTTDDGRGGGGLDGMMTGGGGGGGGGGPSTGGSNQQSFPVEAVVGAVVGIIVLALMALAIVVIIVCSCVKFKMWERKADSVAIHQIEERLLGSRPYDYNKFLPLNSPSEPTPSPRYVTAPRSPLPPIPGYPPGFVMPTKTGFPGPSGTGFPKLQEQDGSAGNPDTDEIYESIDESLFDEYESSYIYHVESVPQRPANTSNVPVPKAPTKPKERDTDSDTRSVGIEEAEVIVNHGTADTPGLGQKVIRAEVHISAVPEETTPEKKFRASKEQPSQDVDDSKTIAEKESNQPSTSTEVNINVKDVEDEEIKMAGNSAAEESPESTTKEQKITLPDCNAGSGCPPMTTTENADRDGSGGDFASNANANATESEKRLSALKDAWESQDKEDVAYLKIVL